MGDSSLSLWSEDSFLSIASSGSALSIGSVGSVLSIGSVGSAASALSIGSAASFGSAMSAGSFGSLLSSGSRGALLGVRAAPQAYWLGAGALAAAAAALVWTARRDRCRPADGPPRPADRPPASAPAVGLGRRRTHPDNRVACVWTPRPHRSAAVFASVRPGKTNK